MLNQPTIATSAVSRPTHLEINLAHITANYHAIQTQVQRPIMTILKANAYGHGMLRLAQQYELLNAPYFGVAYLEEGILLRQAGITTPILVLGGIATNQIYLFIEYELTITASSIEKLEAIEEIAETMGKKVTVHLKIDTGMERIGVHYYNAEQLLKASLNCSWAVIEGIYSHFANSDSADLTHAHIQLERFNEVLSFYTKNNLPMPIRHMANSGAVLQMPESYFDMVRPGIMLYGVYPSNDVKKTIPLLPALSWKTSVVYFKVVQPNHPISYGSKWESDKQTRIVTLPVGYGDGYFRAMSGSAEVIIRGKRYGNVGRICMDQMMVNIDWETAYNGDDVWLLGTDPQSGKTIRIEEMAEWAGTIPYEILTNINTRVPRIYKYE